MVDITRKVEVSISLSGFDMGRAFAELDCTEQALFWGGVASVTKDWDKHPAFQWQMMRDALETLPNSLEAFKGIAAYGPDFETLKVEL
jgi:hypothetical protein